MANRKKITPQVEAWLNSPLVKEFLSEYKSKNTVRLIRHRLSKFFEWSQKSPEELSKLSPKEAKHMILQFQRDRIERGVPNNSILAYISATKTFLEYCGITIKFRRGQLVNPQEGLGYHNFSNGDLQKMFEIANTQYKALIALATSCGFGIGDILSLDRKEIESYIERARQNNEQFIFVEKRRKKTNARSLLVLNPLAIEWLSKWFRQWKGKSIFTVKEDAINRMLRKLAERAGIRTTGKIRFHKIRSWVMNSLAKAGFNEFEIKYIVGKTIPLSDATYLSLKQSIVMKYPKIYSRYLCITESIDRSIETERKLLRAEKIITKLTEQIEDLYGQLNQQSNFLEILCEYVKRGLTAEEKQNLRKRLLEITPDAAVIFKD